ncbi:flagellar basal body rod modification protein FlgD [Mesorhizobium sp. L-8-10]|uniref:flagellar hook assembly protein FlgD n=1 Tax=unclassified Mesorhizobium TaxID=325217 RepID=UPI001926D7B1|nr:MULTISPECIES: flagellar hook assembly protein FlgD [unclassified Mesorhizobium]BCH23135.1 flagellar basal body rod modification protein FlgD [Mesorhizobium sp. L-8-3]BCH30944.1 flagellar basal body rod modification protein FlgD [Mesorhizobium sp. L-8-10]
MAIPGLSGVSNTSNTGNTDNVAKANVDYQSFLKLLVAEMKHQDPTNPMDATQYVSQLASFSQVEQSVQINSKLENILATSQLSQASSVIGKHLTSADGAVKGVVAEVRLYSDGIIAVLDTGKEVLVQPGVKVKDAA